MMIPKSTNTDLVTDMIGVLLADMVTINYENAQIKWILRKDPEKSYSLKKPRRFNFLKGISNDWCSILKMQCKLCPMCINTPNNGTMNEHHMETIHEIEMTPYKTVWNEIKWYYLEKLKEIEKKKDITKRLRRDDFINYWNEMLSKIKEDTEKKLHDFLVMTR